LFLHFYIIISPQPISTLFPYTTLFRSALRKTKFKSASGSSSISYLLIKKVGSIVQKFFRHLADICIFEGEIPVKWKLSQLSFHRSEEHTSELQSLAYLVCRLLLEKKKK